MERRCKGVGGEGITRLISLPPPNVSYTLYDTGERRVLERVTGRAFRRKAGLPERALCNRYNPMCPA